MSGRDVQAPAHPGSLSEKEALRLVNVLFRHDTARQAGTLHGPDLTDVIQAEGALIAQPGEVVLRAVLSWKRSPLGLGR